MSAAFTMAWQHAAGLIMPEQLPMRAAELLAAGEDSPALRDLAGRSRHEDTAELGQLFRQTLADLGQDVPDEDTVGRCLLHHLAAGLEAGEVTATEVCTRLWDGGAAETDLEKAFLRAAVDAVEYVDYYELYNPAAYRAWEEKLRAAARALAAERATGPLGAGGS
ncbi:hypothetical protein [Kitasatospora sp. NPDC097643]|uniref:hypothetical protein n=1 Tax=Kitasatospora sp. NPDC097643 TaxID=3157230 RepID=UPI003316A917